jgi:D-glycero-D-manno-heptose 1,7-bisphosphate phosphatase
VRIEPGVLTFGAHGAAGAARLALLDRDGVLIIDHGHVATPGQVEWIAGVPQAIRALRDAGYAVVIVTNQAGIAKGLFSEEQFVAFTCWLVSELAIEGAVIDAVYYCPHHPTEGHPPWLVDCPCRKPKPGMLLRALDDAQASPALSLMIGDKQTDIEAAQAAGVPGYLFSGKDLGEFVRRIVEPAPPQDARAGNV